MTAVHLDHVSHTYPGAIPALRGITMPITAGETLALLGPTGSGKSTLLRLLAGLESPTAGRVLFDGVDVTATAPHLRHAALVTQRHVLYPHLSVRENLAFGLPRPDLAPVIERLSLGPLLDRRPDQLSGGQIQRVALGRALARKVSLLLLDEPLGHLDPPTRWELLCDLPLLQAGGGFTMVYVTHEQGETFALADRVAVLDAGRLLQVGTPREVRDRPASLSAARLLGWPPLNVLRGTLRNDAAGVHLDTPTRCVPLPSQLQSWRRFDGRAVLLGFRPDAGLLPLTEGRAVGPWLVGEVGGQRVAVARDASFDPAAVFLFDVTTGTALAHGAEP